MSNGSIELFFLGIAFLLLQFWWIRMTIKNGRTFEIDQWGKRAVLRREDEIEKKKEILEKLFKN